MKEIYPIFKREILALNSGLEKLRNLKDAIRKSEDSSLVKNLARETEEVLTELAKIADLKDECLKKRKANNMEELSKAQELQNDKEVVVRLLSRIKELEKQFSEELAVTRELLNRAVAFTEFHINVLAGAKADTTYGLPGKSQGDAVANKMFEANV